MFNKKLYQIVIIQQQGIDITKPYYSVTEIGKTTMYLEHNIYGPKEKNTSHQDSWVTEEEDEESNQNHTSKSVM